MSSRQSSVRRRQGRRYPSLWARIRANVAEHPPPAWVELETACWLWQGSLNARGYGHMAMRRPVYDADGKARGNLPRKVLVHRLVLYLTGHAPHEVPVASHLCGVKRCCNPDHLEPATADQNRTRYYTFELPARQAVDRGNMDTICPESAPVDREPGSDDEG